MNAHPAHASDLDLGGTLLSFVPDGQLRADPNMAYPAGHDDIFADGLNVVDEEGMLVLSIGAILVTTPTKRVLIDAGIGDRTIPIVRPGTDRAGFMGGGSLLQSLSAAHVGPDQIDAILISHLHADHVGWIGNENQDGLPTFPNAEYWISDSELDFWKRPENQGESTGPRPNELDIISAHKRSLVDGVEPVEGIVAVETAGHTPGHFAFSIRGTRSTVLGDAVHCPAEILHPDLGWAGDLDVDAAVQTRRRIVTHIGATGATVVGPHFPNTIFMSFEQDQTTSLFPLDRP